MEPASKPVSLLYLAGLFDGEGSVSIARSLPHGKTKSASPRYQLQVTLTNAYASIMEYCHETFGGHLSWKEPKAPGLARVGNWQANARVAAHFLSQIEPYLVVKQKQARLGIEFDSRFAGPRTQRLSAAEISERESWRLEVLQYNKRYLPVSKPWICVDLDGTLMEDGFYPGYGPPMPGAANAMKMFHDQGIGIMVFTARMATVGVDGTYQNTNKINREILSWAKRHKVWIDFVYPIPKPTFTLAFFDDRAVRFTPGRTGWSDAVKQFTDQYGDKLHNWQGALAPPPIQASAEPEYG